MNFILCPNCGGMIEMIEINCAIARHGVMKNGIQVNPHAEKKTCEKLVKEGLVFGYCLPFRVIKEGEKLVAIACEYI